MTDLVPEVDHKITPRWHRVVLKLSGEALASSLSDETIDASTVGRLAKEIAGSARSELDIEIAIVVGGGNIWRGTTGRAKAWIVPPRTSWACSALSSTRSPCKMPSSEWAVRQECSPRSTWPSCGLHTPSRHPSPGKRACRHLCGRHGEPVLHN